MRSDMTSRELARDAKSASLKLRVVPSARRVELLERFADAVEKEQKQILEKNAIDVQNASGKIAEALMKRLELKEGKLQSAVAGIRQIARAAEPIGRVLARTRIMKGLVLEKISVPIGVLLIIFEARPEALLQITALAIRSGNGLLLKGGKEAAESNRFLHQIVADVLDTHLPEVGSGLIGLIEKREEIPELLKLDDVIDLVIPRGSSQLVRQIQQNTKIAVLGHADGICHVYVDKDADISMAEEICLDAKLDYPAACNAVETVLVHQALTEGDAFNRIRFALSSKGVQLHRGKHPWLADFAMEPAPSLSHEYSSLHVTLEVVEDLDHAIEHINTFGSGHTDSIVTESRQQAEAFLSGVDSACVLHNASTRWSDGYRFGLGAEVGISTSRIHARGPVGVEGLMTSKFVLKGGGHVVRGDANKSAYEFASLMDGGDRWQSKALYATIGAIAAFAFIAVANYAGR